MTEEDREKLVARFRAHEVVMWTDIDLAADEIERLAEENDDLKVGIELLEHEMKYGND